MHSIVWLYLGSGIYPVPITTSQDYGLFPNKTNFIKGNDSKDLVLPPYK